MNLKFSLFNFHSHFFMVIMRSNDIFYEALHFDFCAQLNVNLFQIRAITLKTNLVIFDLDLLENVWLLPINLSQKNLL